MSLSEFPEITLSLETGAVAKIAGYAKDVKNNTETVEQIADDLQDVVDDAIEATANANTATDLITNPTTGAIKQVDDKIDEAVIVIAAAEVATENLIDTAEQLPQTVLDIDGNEGLIVVFRDDNGRVYGYVNEDGRWIQRRVRFQDAEINTADIELANIERANFDGSYIQSYLDPDLLYAISDADGNFIFGIDNTGAARMPGGTTLGGGSTQEDNFDYGVLMAFADRLKNVIASVGMDGVWSIPKMNVGELTAKTISIESMETRLKLLERRQQALETLSTERQNKFPRDTNGLARDSAVILSGGVATSTDAVNPSAKSVMVTFIDDDSIDRYDQLTVSGAANPYRGGYYTRLRHVFSILGAPFVEAVITGANSVDTFPGGPVTAAQLVAMQDAGICEFANHTKNHVTFDPTHPSYDPNYNIAEQWGEAFIKLRRLGIDVNSAVYPFGHNNHAIRDYLVQEHRSGTTTDVLTNLPPLRQFLLGRAGLDYATTFTDQQVFGTQFRNLAAWKSVVDTAETGGRWLIFMSHAYANGWTNFAGEWDWVTGDITVAGEPDYDPNWIVPTGATPVGWRPQLGTRLHDLYELIQYIQGKGIPIVTLEQGLNQYGNLANVGDYTNGIRPAVATGDETNYPHFVVGVDGSTSYKPQE
jgi:hypothetical protein